MLKNKDVCIIIPTYNRPEDLERTLKSNLLPGNIPGKIVILDQSKNEKSKDMAKKYLKKYPFIKYNHYKIAGTNKALNKGIEIAKKEKYKLIGIVADDVEVFKGFLKGVLDEYNSNKKVVGVGTPHKSKPFNYSSQLFRLKKFLLNFFLLPTPEDHKYRITGPYGNTATPCPEKDVRDCQWLPGFVTFYKTEVFENYEIPDRIGYDVIEDIDLGYYTYKKYGKGSLVILKDVQVYHHHSSIERYADKKRIFVNHEDHISFYYRYFDNFSGTLKLIWELWWINLLNIARIIIKPKKTNVLKLIYLWQALIYCRKYRKQIKAGKSRMFLNTDLSMKDDW